MLSKRIRYGLLAPFLMLSLTACSVFQRPPPQVQTVVQKPLPPDSLLADCPHAAIPTSRTNAALAVYARNERSALSTCNTDKAGLRAWKAKELGK
jgi:hypothetical protein